MLRSSSPVNSSSSSEPMKVIASEQEYSRATALASRPE
jgi:hypothetical protein